MEVNKIYNESNLETMARMPDCFIDLTVTSPPYDNLRNYNGYSFDFESVAKELYRITTDGGVVVWNVSDSTINGSETLTSFKQCIFFVDVCGFNLHDTMIYATNKPPQNSNRYESEFEYMFVLSKGKPSVFNPIKRKSKWNDKRKEKGFHREKSGEMKVRVKESKGECAIGNIWYYDTGGGHSTSDSVAFKHPAIFPEKLAADHIYSWSNEGDLVYDPFGGSGTTAKMAHLQKRNWILSEISEEYCQLAEKRIAPYLAQMLMF